MNHFHTAIFLVIVVGFGFAMYSQEQHQEEEQGPGLNYVSGQAPWSIQTAEGCYYWRDKDGYYAGHWLLEDGVTAKCNGAKNK